MKRIKKLIYLFICLTAFMAMANRVAAAAPNGTYDLTYISSDKKSVRIGVSINSVYAEVGLWNASGNYVKSVQCYSNSYATFSGLTKNRLYYFAVRGLAYDSTKRAYTATTDWSARKAFVTAKYTLSLVSKKSRTVKFKFPKVTGVKSYTLYMSTKQNSGYKKLKTIKPGKTYKVSKFKKKTFTYYKNYYYKIVPKLKSGGSAAAYMDGFYIYRTYR